MAANKDAIGIFPLMLIRTAGLPLRFVGELSGAWPDELEENARVRAAFDALLSQLEESDFRTAVYNARKAFFQRQKMPPEAFFRELIQYQHIPEAVSLKECLCTLKEHKAGDIGRYEIALQENYRAMQRAAFEETLRRGLLFASHDLLDRLPGFCERPVGSFSKKDRRVALSLLKYLTRAAVKTTPLSRFSTVSWLHFEEGRPDGAPSWTKSEVVPNVALLPAIYEVLLREPVFYRSLSVVLNACITTSGERLSWLFFDGEQESFQHLEGNAVASLIVQRLLSKQRKMPWGELLDMLEKEVTASRGQLEALLTDLIDVGMLEWDFPEKGLSPGWCGGLYQYLGFLPQPSPLIVETAALLQWLRTSARTLSYLSVEEAQIAQGQTTLRVNEYFNLFGGTTPPLPPEQIFFEDVNEDVETEVSAGVVRQLIGDLADCWRENPGHSITSLHARVINFGREMLDEGESVGFVAFYEQFLKQGAAQTISAELPSGRGKAGALLQIFKKETGEYGAVVNGLFPGGGKLFARWLHLFPAQFQHLLAEWNDAVPFPWQGWSNANFQPAAKNTLSVPDGRMAAKAGGRQAILGNIMVRRINDLLQLFDNETKEVIQLTDLGLEAAELRPASMQVLQCLGMSYFSLHPLIREHQQWKTGGAGWRFRDRAEFRSLVLLRKAWEISPGFASAWPGKPGEARFFHLLRRELSAIGVPPYFFTHFNGEKPQYFDFGSPISMYLFGKMLKQTDGPFVLTEMLPLPEECVVHKHGLHAAEFVVEFEV